MYNVSVIIPVYNAANKIRKTLSSILNQTMDFNKIEVILVDDKSTDTSVELINTYVSNYTNVKLYQLATNSGSPSKPRNLGVKKAQSDYIIFLDSDDTLHEHSCQQLYNAVLESNLDIVRGYLQVIKGNSRYTANRLDVSSVLKMSKQDLIQNFVSKQSSTVVGIYRKQFLIEKEVFFDDTIRMGEDTLFLSKCYVSTSRISYIDVCIYDYMKRDEIHNISSTQSYGSKELNDHITVWESTQKILSKIKIDYYKSRLPVGFRAVLESIRNYSNGLISKEDFLRLHNFLKKVSFIIPQMNLSKRLQDICDCIFKNDYSSFVTNTRKRLLINGYDLKFIKPLLSLLRDRYEIRIDEWNGHNDHDEMQSLNLLEWADVIFCEWMLGNAVWYSKNKRPDQILFIRMHRFELFREFGFKIDKQNVDAFIAVGMFYYEEFMKKFELPRSKMKLIPNYVDIDKLDNKKNMDSNYNIAIIGVSPARKRLDRAIEILEYLLNSDSRYKLHVVGTKPEDQPWLWKIKEEREFYESVYKKLDESPGLKKSVIFAGWQKSTEYLKSIGYVISVSDSDKPESFHLSPAEGMASNAIGLLLNWPGVEYIYPSCFIRTNVTEIAEAILSLNRQNEHEKLVQKARIFVESYDLKKVSNEYEKLIASKFLQKN
ncbi:glycosyltransferase [Paenibacillus xylanexedens]|uniref:glycosyltransferase n=1 Tax=Paenibacillus xylanexedens TaxID=528191 RepID=UPI0011AA3E94|nr:glycosyltransferase [Paenibacillus xylanexedens]